MTTRQIKDKDIIVLIKDFYCKISYKTQQTKGLLKNNVNVKNEEKEKYPNDF